MVNQESGPGTTNFLPTLPTFTFLPTYYLLFFPGTQSFRGSQKVLVRPLVKKKVPVLVKKYISMPYRLIKSIQYAVLTPLHPCSSIFLETIIGEKKKKIA